LACPAPISDCATPGLEQSEQAPPTSSAPQFSGRVIGNEAPLTAKGNSVAPVRRASANLDWIIVTSETHHNYPSLSAKLHSRLLVRENCGRSTWRACLGLLNALAVAQSLIAPDKPKRSWLSRGCPQQDTYAWPRRRRIGGLFGMRKRFILRSAPAVMHASSIASANYFWLCGPVCCRDSGEASQGCSLGVQFDAKRFLGGSRAGKVLASVEQRSASPRLLAVLRPTSRIRLVALSANIAAFSPSTFSAIARISGNLGSSTCGAPCMKPCAVPRKKPGRAPADFCRFMGPGLLFGGGWLLLTKIENRNSKLC